MVLAKLNGVTGVLNKLTNVFTQREWTLEEHERYNANRGQQQLEIDEQIVNNINNN